MATEKAYNVKMRLLDPVAARTEQEMRADIKTCLKGTFMIGPVKIERVPKKPRSASKKRAR